MITAVSDGLGIGDWRFEFGASVGELNWSGSLGSRKTHSSNQAIAEEWIGFSL
jgi:hypothetical protein